MPVYRFVYVFLLLTASLLFCSLQAHAVTLTRMTDSGSPLINTGGAATDIAGMSLATDQRGRARFKSSAADIGAVESSSMHCFPIRKVDGGIGIICF